MLTKKVVKVVIVLLMVLGVGIAASNVFNTPLHAGKWVHYDADAPNCKGLGDTCFDFTAPTP